MYKNIFMYNHRIISIYIFIYMYRKMRFSIYVIFNMYKNRKNLYISIHSPILFAQHLYALNRHYYS